MGKFSRSLLCIIFATVFVLSGCKNDDSVDVTGSDAAATVDAAALNYKHNVDVSRPEAPQVYTAEDEDDFDIADTSLERTYTTSLSEPSVLAMRFERNSDLVAAPEESEEYDLINNYIKITPEVSGNWYWTGPYTAAFYPDAQWPANAEYKITLDKRLVNPSYKLKTNDVTFTTVPFTARTEKKLQIYQSPMTEDGTLSAPYAIATIRFSHPVDAASFERDTKVRLDGKDINFTATYDTVNTFAYIKTADIKITDKAGVLELRIPNSVTTSFGGAKLKEELTERINVPTMSDFFSVNSIDTTMTKDEEGTQQQLIMLDFSLPVSATELSKNIIVYKLPYRYKDESNYDWIDEFHTTPAADLAKLTKLKLEVVETAAGNLLGVKFFVHPDERIALGVVVKKGTKAANGYTLSKDTIKVVTVPRFSTDLKFTQDGNILTLSGDKMLTFISRGINKARVTVARVQQDRLNHLISQTYGDLKNARFENYEFNENDIADLFSEEITLNNSNPAKYNYFSLNLGKYLENAGAGIFIVNVYPWKPSGSGGYYDDSYSDRRLIQVTDIGILTKQPISGPLNVFVVSMRSGTPMQGANVSILTRNGKQLGSAYTDASGMATLTGYNTEAWNEKQQVAIVVQSGRDYSFIPIGRNEVSYSRFDIGGEYANAGRNGNIAGLKSYLFTDRGLYRPGDTVNIGAIVKQDDWRSVSGVPMELTIINPKGQEVLKRRFTMDDTGFTEINFPTEYTSPTGIYQMSVGVLRDSSSSVQWDYRQVGATSFSVEEFKPDTMKINAVLSGAPAAGWMSPDDITLDVTLNNLFGRPAQGRRITWNYTMRPVSFGFSAYRDYTFVDPYRDSYTGRYPTIELSEATTDDNGMAQQKLDLSAYTAGMYNLNAYVEGFEDGSGDSVNTITAKYVSPMKYLLGYKTKGKLSYAKKDDKLQVDFIAINPNIEQIDLSGLTYTIKERRYVSLLVRQRDSTYAFQSVPKELDVSSGKLDVAKNGKTMMLPTNNPGNFYMDVLDRNNLRMARIEYFVAGTGNLTLAMDKNTELNLTLSKPEYNSGEMLELNIIAPYVGTGLITIEKDRVYAHKWFTTSTTSSRQTIQVPADLEGNGYVNVSFVRSPSSPDVLTMPHTYAVVPFNVNRAAHTTGVELDIPEEARPGEPFTIDYMASKTGKIVVYAVDEGILQVANYRLPRPLDAFMRKRALQVRTFQILNQLLTDYSVMRQISGIGGDDMVAGEAASQLNPFRRKADAPVVYWSGIRDVTAGQTGTVTYNVPSHFNGTLRVMAVAVSDTSMGSAQDTMLVRAPIIVQPNMPLVLTPGDKAGMSITISNNIAGSGKDTEIVVEVKGDKYLSIAGEAKRTIKLNEGYEGRVDFEILANKELGSGTVTITASAPKYPDAKINITSTASVRPATAYNTVVTVGASDRADVVLKGFSRDMYTELAERNATASHSPLLIARGLSAYLKKYPHGCTEQITSQAFPALKIRRTYWSEQEATETFRRVVDMLRSRQLANGGFTLWSGGWSNVHEYATVYAMHYLTEAKLQGFPVPPDLFTAGQKWLTAYISEKATNLYDARQKVYAAYVLTRGGIVTSAFLANIEEYLDKSYAKEWKSDVISSYIAAIYKMHQMDEKANGLIKGYIPEVKKRWVFYSDFDSSSLRNTQYLYLLATHFADDVNKVDIDIVLNLLNSIEDQHYSSILSSYTILALYAFAAASEGYDDGMQIFVDAGKEKNKALNVGFTPYPTADYTGKVDRLLAQSKQEGKFGLFLVATEQGFDLNLPKAESEGIKVTREYLDANGKTKKTFKQGDDVIVKIYVEANGNLDFIENGVITDLLPGALEVQMDSISALRGSTYAGSYSSRAFDYVDVREDRLVFYAPIRESGTTFTYKARVTSRGEFVIPAVYAAAMYDPVYRGNSASGKMVATEE